MVNELLKQYFVQTGVGWAIMGAMFAAMFACIGSARGIRVAASQAAGVLSEKPELYGKLLILMALPGTQGFYGFVFAFLVWWRTELLGATSISLSPLIGLGIFFTGLCMGIVQWRSAVYQGETSAACINLTGKRPEEGGRAIVMPALVETYAVVALLVAFLMLLFITRPGMVFTNPMMP